MNSDQLIQEFDRQVQNLLEKGFPEAAGLSEEEFLKHVLPLKDKVKDLNVDEKVDLEKGYLPFVIVIKSDLVPTDKAMSLIEREGKQGVVKLYPLEPKDFSTIEEVSLPNNVAYLLVGIDRGEKTLNIRPSEAMDTILSENHSPLTIDEGVAIVLQYPGFLMKNNCFSLLASRHPGDQRVPAIWINSEKRPNLGWCWNGNPHTWLGSASAVSRVS